MFEIKTGEMSDNMLMLISMVASNLITWQLTRRKNRAEAKGSELDNVEKAVTIWRQLSEDMTQKFTKEIEELRLDNEKLQRKVSDLENENKKLRKQLQILSEPKN